MKNKHCEWCDSSFEARVSYQIYCSPDCRQAATREKINQRYLQKRRDKRRSKPKLCKSCKKPLSVYNDEQLCHSCLVNPKEVKDALKDLKDLFDEDK